MARKKKEPQPQPESHAMEIVKKHPTGWSEFLCPICGRHFIMRMPPDYARVSLDEGDENAVHTYGGLNAHIISVEDEKWLRPFQDFLDNANSTT